MNRGKIKNLLLLKSAVGTWATSSTGTEWLMPVQLVGEHRGG